MNKISQRVFFSLKNTESSSIPSSRQRTWFWRQQQLNNNKMNSFQALATLLLSIPCFLVRGDEKTFDCPMRQLALEWAIEIQPSLSHDQLQEIADALNGSPEAQNCSVSPEYIDYSKLGRDPPPKHRLPKVWNDVDGKGIQIFVDPRKGDDSNPGLPPSLPLPSLFTPSQNQTKKTKKKGRKKSLFKRSKAPSKNLEVMALPS